jgi:hypothetical protein
VCSLAGGSFPAYRAIHFGDNAELRDRSQTSSVNQHRTGENQPTEPICLGRGKPGFLTHEDKVTRKTDSLLEGPEFELSVPRKRDRFLKFAHKMAARKAYAQQSSAITATTGSSIPRGLNREPATMRPDSAGHCTKKLLETRTTPSSVPARRS